MIYGIFTERKGLILQMPNVNAHYMLTPSSRNFILQYFISVV